MLQDALHRRAIRRIVIIKPTALGDVVQSLPLLPALKQRFPEATIAWVIQAGLTDVLAGHPDLAECIPYHRQGNWRDWQRLLTTLWSRKFDLAIDMQGLLRTGVMTLATRAPIRLGLETAREGSRWALTHVVPESSRQVPAWERYLRVLDAVQADRTQARTTLSISQSDLDWTALQLAELPRPLIAVHPGARWETKRWPVEKFAELLHRAATEWQAGVVILGSQAECADADQLAQILQRNTDAPVIRNLTGQTTLKQLAAILQRVDAVISNDSGPMHLAAGLGTPTLGIFTCTDASRSGPGGVMHELVSTRVACAASYCKTCPHTGAAHLACFRELDVDRVWQALRKLLHKNSVIDRNSAAA